MSKFKQIANYQYTSEAYLFKGKLESEGIEVFCKMKIQLIQILY